MVARWAKKKFGRRLHPTTQDVVQETVTTTLRPRKNPNPVSTSNRFTALVNSPSPTLTAAPITSTTPRNQDQYEREWPTLKQAHTPRSAAPNPHQVQAQKLRRTQRTPNITGIGIRNHYHKCPGGRDRTITTLAPPLTLTITLTPIPTPTPILTPILTPLPP